MPLQDIMGAWERVMAPPGATLILMLPRIGQVGFCVYETETVCA